MRDMVAPSAPRGRVALSKTRCHFLPQRDRGAVGGQGSRPPPCSSDDRRRHTVPVQRSADRDQRQPMSKTIQTGSPVRGRFPVAPRVMAARRRFRRRRRRGAPAATPPSRPNRRRLHAASVGCSFNVAEADRCAGRCLSACTGRADAAHRQSTGSVGGVGIGVGRASTRPWRCRSRRWPRPLRRRSRRRRRCTRRSAPCVSPPNRRRQQRRRYLRPLCRRLRAHTKVELTAPLEPPSMQLTDSRARRAPVSTSAALLVPLGQVPP